MSLLLINFEVIMKRLNYEAFGITDVGTIKEVNQDSFVYKVVEIGDFCCGIFAVADGVGGLENGEIASSIAISCINKWWENDFKNNFTDLDFLVKSLIQTIKDANVQIKKLADAKSVKMATTLTVLFLYRDSYFIINVGDSRIYKLNNSFGVKISQLTQDHSQIIEKIYNGQLVRKSVLTQCLGNKDNFEYSCVTDKLKKNDYFMLCSDGIYKTQPCEVLARIFKENVRYISKICSGLIDNAKANNEKDNISVIVVKITD